MKPSQKRIMALEKIKQGDTYAKICMYMYAERRKAYTNIYKEKHSGQMPPQNILDHYSEILLKEMDSEVQSFLEDFIRMEIPESDAWYWIKNTGLVIAMILIFGNSLVIALLFSVSAVFSYPITYNLSTTDLISTVLSLLFFICYIIKLFFKEMNAKPIG